MANYYTTKIIILIFRVKKILLSSRKHDQFMLFFPKNRICYFKNCTFFGKFKVTKAPPISSAHPLLDENSQEILDFRELLSICPMVIPPKIDIRETIGSGKFGLIHKGIMQDTKQEAMVHSATSKCGTREIQTA